MRREAQRSRFRNFDGAFLPAIGAWGTELRGSVEAVAQSRPQLERSEPRELHSAGRLRLIEAALGRRTGAAQARGGDLTGTLAAPHHACDLVGFEQPVHAAAKAVLVAMFAGTEVLAGSRPDAAQRFAA